PQPVAAALGDGIPDLLDSATRILHAVAGGAEAIAALTLGERDENRLTDIMCFARQPERQGRLIQQEEKQLALEWIAVRDSMVRPVLRVMQTAPMPAVAPSAVASTPLPPPAVPFEQMRLRRV